MKRTYHRRRIANRWQEIPGPTGKLSLWIWEPDDIDAKPGPIRRILQVFDLAVHGFSHHRCSRMATSLTFYTLLSIVPVLALAFSLSKNFEDRIRPWILRELRGSEQLQNALDRILDLAQKTDVSALGGLGVILLVYLVLRTIGTVERSFNEIWGIARDRSWIRKLTDYLTLIVIGPLFFFAIAGLTGFEYRTAQAVSFEIPVLGVVKGSQIAGLILVWIGFALIYLLVPNRRVRLRGALVGAILAGSLWKLVLRGYIELQIGVSQNAAIYGAFAAFPIFLVWVQVSWLVVLGGAEVAAATENRGRRRQRLLADEVHYRERLSITLRMLCEAARRLADGEKPAPLDGLADELRAPRELVRDVAERLARTHIVRVSENPEPALVLVAAPQAIRVRRALAPFDPRFSRARRKEVPKRGNDAIESLLDRIDAAEARVLGDLTLADLQCAFGRDDSADSDEARGPDDHETNDRSEDEEIASDAPEASAPGTSEAPTVVHFPAEGYDDGEPGRVQRGDPPQKRHT